MVNTVTSVFCDSCGSSEVIADTGMSVWFSIEFDRGCAVTVDMEAYTASAYKHLCGSCMADAVHAQLALPKGGN